MNYKLKENMKLKHGLTALVLYPFIVPAVIMDLSLEIYHNIGFRLCNLDLVDRSKYIKMDRKKLRYLNKIEKINCTYCGYTNGLLNYATEIAGRSEEYWCGIKHEDDENFLTPRHHKEFPRFDNKQEFLKKYNK